MYTPFDQKKYAELAAELNMLAPSKAETFLAVASETAVLKTLENFELPEDIYWKHKLGVLAEIISSLKKISIS